MTAPLNTPGDEHARFYREHYAGAASAAFERVCVRFFQEDQKKWAGRGFYLGKRVPGRDEYTAAARRWKAAAGVVTDADRDVMIGAGCILALAGRPGDSDGGPRLESFGLTEAGVAAVEQSAAAHEKTQCERAAKRFYWTTAAAVTGWVAGLVGVAACFYDPRHPYASVALPLLLSFCTPLALPPLLGAVVLGVLASRVAAVVMPDLSRPKELVEAEAKLEAYRAAVAEFEQRRKDEEEWRRKQTVDYWMALDGWSFEAEVAALYEAAGYRAQVTTGSNDGGVDIVLERGGRKAVVQCKRHYAACPPSVIRELYGSMIHEGADEAIAVCTGGFSRAATEFARGKPIRLVGMEELLLMAGA